MRKSELHKYSGMANTDQLFSNMHAAALGWLRDCAPSQICCRGGLAFSDGAFHTKSLGQELVISCPDYAIEPQLHQWHTLTILHYLARADGSPLSGELITFGQYKDGMVRGGGFDRRAENVIAAQLGNLSKEELIGRIHRLGGKILSGNADLCAAFDFLPNYPVYLKIWFADEEFPASGRMLLDASAPHYLTIEDAVAVGELILEELSRPEPEIPG